MILSYLLLYKYIALFAITFLAALALPIPSAATLMASAAFASQGFFNIYAVILIAFLGNILGDSLGYWLVRIYGKPALRWFGFKNLLESDHLNSIEKFIRRKPRLVVFFSRFEVIATLSVNFVSGFAKLPYTSFLIYDLTGEFIQVLCYSAIGYLFGSSWEAINSLIGKFSLIIALAIVLVMLTFWKRIIRKIISENRAD